MRCWMLVVAAILAACGGEPGDETPPGTTGADQARYVGRESCRSCHAAEYRDWEGSHHDLAMQPADETTVLGDFDDATFRYGSVTSTFFRRDGKFLVRTDGSDGELREYEIAYTFGVEPLQQYLIEFPDGRLQALSICWDARPAGFGGQRWFHLYPDEKVNHEDELHWTARTQNWNYMCAECHSTRLRKGYDADTNRFETSWFEIDVSCEACHGPGSSHVEWADAGADDADSTRGFLVQLRDPDGGSWLMNQETGIALRSIPRSSQAELETCARCHSRRSLFDEEYLHGRSLLQTHRTALLDERLYHADGQILDEVYVYGSFLQSRMHSQGVTCSDCHDPHTLRLRAPGNAVCATCHLPARFDAPSHHFHTEGLPGSACVDCHMPQRNYMVVDPRGDHSFRVPRPDLTVRIGTPNACNDCHADRSAEWAGAAVVAWYGRDRSRHYAEALHQARENTVDAVPALNRVLADATTPGIVRATAASLLASRPNADSLPAIETALADDDPLVRFGALLGIEPLDGSQRLRLASGLLEDPIRAVRMEAARVLADVPTQSLDKQQRTAFARALEEYREAQRFSGDRPESHLNLGLLHVRMGELEQAERAYSRAIEMSPEFIPGYVNLADLYRVQGRDAEGERLLRGALVRSPADADAQHALGLLLARQQRYDEAMPALARAAELRPDVVRYAFVYGVALQSMDRNAQALEVLAAAHVLHPRDPDLLIALATMHRDQRDLDGAIRYARKLVELMPRDRAAQQLLAELEASRR